MNQEDIRKALLAYVPFHEQEAADRATLLRYCETFPDLLYRENPIAHFSSSALVVNRAGDRVLLGYHNLYCSWGWLGGHADGDADLLAVAIREVGEESGLAAVTAPDPDFFAIDILPVWGHKKHGIHLSSHLHLSVCYLLVGDDSLPLRHKPDENSAVGWKEAGELLSLCREEEMVPVYEKLLKKARIQGYLAR